MRERIRLPDPELCRHCHTRGRVIKSHRGIGYRRRRHECQTCRHRWSSWQMIVSPRNLFVVRAAVPSTL